MPGPQPLTMEQTGGGSPPGAVGDVTYGGVRRHPPAHLRAVGRLERPFLHAARLAFSHPRDRRPMEFSTPLPADLQAILDELRVTAGD